MDFVFHIQECLICEFHFHILSQFFKINFFFWGGGGGVRISRTALKL